MASKHRDAVDIIIALGMAKEGFDWPFAEHALTVGYRASLTEIIQIIGRVTRDSEGKSRAQFTNLIAEPDASQNEVAVAVNNMLKAITASLLMEQVLAPNFAFKAKQGNDDTSEPGTLRVRGFKEPSTARVKQIIQTDLNDLKANILQDDNFARAAAGSVDPQSTNKILIPKIIRQRYPDLTESEVEEVRQHVVIDSVVKTGEVKEVGDKRFVKLANRFVNLDELNTPNVLRLISDTIAATRLDIAVEEALEAFPQIQHWAKVNGKRPDRRSEDATERYYAECLLILRRFKQESDRRRTQESASQED